MTLREKYTIGLEKLGFVEQITRSTRYTCYVGTTAMLYGIDPKESNEPRYVFVSNRGPSIRVGRTAKATDYTMPLTKATKTRLIAYCMG